MSSKKLRKEKICQSVSFSLLLLLLHIATNDNRGGHLGELGMGSGINVPDTLPQRYSAGAGCPYRPVGVW